jgi:hypothetical protein
MFDGQMRSTGRGNIRKERGTSHRLSPSALPPPCPPSLHPYCGNKQTYPGAYSNVELGLDDELFPSQLAVRVQPFYMSRFHLKPLTHMRNISKMALELDHFAKRSEEERVGASQAGWSPNARGEGIRESVSLREDMRCRCSLENQSLSQDFTMIVFSTAR